MSERLRVLVVDDEPAILRALGRELADVATVRTAGSVNEALTLVDNEVFDVVIADLRMPDRWGDELLAYVAARAPETRRLLLTADNDPQRTVAELLEQQVIEACFRKPWGEDLLRTVVAAPDR
jgi:response regulator RpfG family c-di-GMP phosphodiesterase